MTYILPEERVALRKLALKTNEDMELMQVPPLGLIRLLDEIETTEEVNREFIKTITRLGDDLAKQRRHAADVELQLRNAKLENADTANEMYERAVAAEARAAEAERQRDKLADKLAYTHILISHSNEHKECKVEYWLEWAAEQASDKQVNDK